MKSIEQAIITLFLTHITLNILNGLPHLSIQAKPFILFRENFKIRLKYWLNGKCKP
jgi:hypothetical protein